MPSYPLKFLFQNALTTLYWNLLFSNMIISNIITCLTLPCLIQYLSINNYYFLFSNICLFIYMAGCIFVAAQAFLQMQRGEATHCSGLSCCRAWAVGPMGFNICAPNSNSCCLPAKHRLSSCATVWVASSWIRVWTCVSCTGTWSLSFFLFSSSLLKLISKTIYTVMNFCFACYVFCKCPLQWVI